MNKRFKVVPVKSYGIVKGWSIQAPSGALLNGFTLRAQADTFVDFANDELTILSKQHEAHVESAMIKAHDLGAKVASYIYCCERCEAKRLEGR